MTALSLVRFLNDLTAQHGPATRLSDLPLGCIEAERKRANGNGVIGVAPGEHRVTAAGSPSPSRYDSTPPRPQDVYTAEDRARWDAAHAHEHTIHQCTLGRMHDGPCRCHCGRTFPFDQRGL